MRGMTSPHQWNSVLRPVCHFCFLDIFWRDLWRITWTGAWQRGICICGIYLTNREALTMFSSGKKHSTTSRVTPYTSFVLWPLPKCFYNRTEHSQSFSFCFIIKNPLNYPSITFNFQNKLYFQSEQQCRQHALYSHKARYNKQIRIPVRMFQIIWLAVQD